MRYLNNIFIKKTDTGKRYYSSAILADPVIPDELEQITYTTRLGDRWDTVAYKFFGSATKWYELANANGGANGSIFIEPGTVLIIPTIS